MHTDSVNTPNPPNSGKSGAFLTCHIDLQSHAHQGFAVHRILSRNTPGALRQMDSKALDLTIAPGWTYWIAEVAHYDPLRKLVPFPGTAFMRIEPEKALSNATRNRRQSRNFWTQYSPDIVLENGEIEMRIQKRSVLKAGLAAAALALSATGFAQQKTVTFANQDMLVPLRLVMESGEIEKETGYKINWRMFSGGGDVIRAMASGDVQMGEVGSSPLTAAASQGQDLKLFWISADIANAEALVARNGGGITGFKSMEGKRIGVPFVSTAHYQLIAALGKEGVDARKVNVMNMRPPEIAAAWERGDIDGTFVWDPVLAKVKQKGKVIATSGSIAQMGYPTFEGIAVNAKFAQENPEFMAAFAKALNRASAQVRDNLASWTPDSPEIKAIAKWSKADPKDVPAAMALYRFPSAEEQLSAQWLEGGAAKAMSNTAAFLKSQGRIQEAKPDYTAFVTDSYVKKAVAR